MFLLPWALAIPIFLLDEWVFTFMLRREYTEHRSIWQSDGQPRGVLWIPRECRLGGHAAQKLRWKWLFTTPDWMATDAGNHKALLIHRILMIALVLSVLSPFAIAALVQ
jgi:hypothetical protein